MVKYIGAAVSVKNVPSLPGLVNAKVKTFSIGEYKASANEIINMKIRKSQMFIPKNIGVGPRVARAAPSRIRS